MFTKEEILDLVGEIGVDLDDEDDVDDHEVDESNEERKSNRGE